MEERRKERGEAGCTLIAGWAQEPRNSMKEISGPYINYEELTTTIRMQF